MVAGVSGVAAAGAGAHLQLVLPTASLPGLHSVHSSRGAARDDLAGGLGAADAATVRQAQLETSAARGRNVKLRSDAFTFSSAEPALAVLSVWRAHRHAHRVSVGAEGFLALGRGRGATTVTVAWRESDRIGVLMLRASRHVSDPVALAKEYAVLANSRLRIRTPASAWARVLSETRPNGTLSKATAMEAFVLAYGPLPGVHRPPGRKSRIEDGTLAAEWIERYYSRLTARQKAVVRRRLGVRGSAGAHTASTEPAAHAADLYDPTFQPDTELTALAQSFVPTYTGLVDPGFSLQVVAGITDEVVKTKDGGYVDADALPLAKDGIWGSGQPTICRIRVMQAGLESDAAYLKFVIAHEVFHCFQFDIRADNAWTPLPLWIGEGTAEWAAMTVTQVPFSVGGDWLGQYIQTPQTPLFERSYDASGFWGHTQDINGDLWNRLPGILASGKDDFTSFSNAGANTDDFLDSWGSSIVRPINGGPEWHMDSPIAPPGLKGLAPPFTEIDGSGVVSAPPFTMSIYRLVTPADTPLLHVQIDGPARLSPTENYTDLSDRWFCTLPDGCHCPPDEIDEIPHNYPLPDKTILALSGDPGLGLGGGGTNGTVDAHQIEDFCVPKPSEKQGGPGTSNGDPYMTTFDGGGYGFQTAGEFTLVKSTVDDLEIQSRQVPYPHALLPELARSLAMNTAFAMRDGGAIVEVDKGSPLVLYIDRHRRRAAPGTTIRLKGGGRVRYGARRVLVTWRDGTKATVLSIGDEGVNIFVTPSRKRAGLLAGLLGNDDGDPDNDYVGRGGHRFDATTIDGVGLLIHSRRDVRIVLGPFGRSWRITQRQSLFVYPPGKTTRSYLVRSFPRALLAPASLSAGRRRIARRVCRHDHVTNPLLLAGCVLDYGATGDRRLPAATGIVQHESGIHGSGGHRPSGPTISPVPWTALSAAPDQAGARISPSITVSGGQAVAAYQQDDDHALEAATFDAGSNGVSGVSRSAAFTGWQSLSAPVLVARPSGGTGIVFAGTHSSDGNDPLNGTVVAERGANGTFAAPGQLTSQLGATPFSAVTAADGTTTLWSTGAFQLLVYSGGTVHDDTASSPSDSVSSPTLGRDDAGRVWLAWYVSLPENASGAYIMQLDPQTGTPLGPPAEAPHSGADLAADENFALACAQACRVVYVDSDAGQGEVASWAPGEASPTKIASELIGGRPRALGEITAAYTSSGRLWASFADTSPGILFATLGDARGAGGRLIGLRKPPGFTKAGTDQPAATAAATIGDRLVLATSWQDNGTAGTSQVWATTVNAP
jgi:hypothetical protein